MKLLIIGSEGFIGAHLLDHFNATTFDVFTADVRSTDRPQHYLIDEQHGLKAILSEVKPAVCINASGSANVSKSFEDPEHDRLLNVEIVRTLLEAVRDTSPQTRLLNISSAAVYGTPDSLPVREEDAISSNPISPYGKHKRMSELLIEQFAKEHGVQGLSARVFSCYGEGQCKLLLWDIYQKAKANDFNHLQLSGTGDESRDYVHVRDLCLAFERIIQSAVFDGSSINVASGIETRISEVAQWAAQCINPSMQLTFSHQVRKGDPQNWRADITKLKDLGFSPNIALKQGIREYYEWLIRFVDESP